MSGYHVVDEPYVAPEAGCWTSPVFSLLRRPAMGEREVDIAALEEEARRNRHWRWKLLEWLDFHVFNRLGFCPYCHKWMCGD